MADRTLASERREFYVYVIFRPNGIPCYVGKGHGRRDQHHARFTHNRHLKHIYAQAGGSLPVVRINEHLTDDQACAYELAIITAIGRKSLGTGPLVNLCDGGEGRAGWKPDAEFRRKMSEINKGRKRSPETLALMSQVRIGTRRSEESKAKQSATVTGRKRPGHSSMMKGRLRPDVRAKVAGVLNPKCKLTEDDVRKIKARIAAGEKKTYIARDYGMCKSTICRIANGIIWKDAS